MSKPFEGLGTGAVPRGLAWAYGVGSRTHAAIRLRDVRQVSAPVISVGNLLVGGTGKTPVCIAIAEELSKTKRVAVVSRGYGGREKGPYRVMPGADPRLTGDEPVEMAAAVPAAQVWIARDRVAGAEAAVAAGAELVILDDGFGYRGLDRDVDLVIFDERGLGNGLLLPAGPLRESPENVMRADAVLLRGDAAAPQGFTGPVFRFRAVTGALVDWAGREQPKPAKAVAAAGVAWPGRFFEGLAKQGIELTKTFALTDHAPWPPSLTRRIRQAAGDLPVIVTGKDAVKLRLAPPPGPWLVARQRLEVDPAFWPWLAEHATLLG